MFSGSIPALVTPFTDDGPVRRGRLSRAGRLADRRGLIGARALRHTAKRRRVTAEEHFHIVGVCVDQTAGRVPVIAGAGSNDTVVAAANIARAKQAGADAALMVPPYYNRPSQEGIYQHFAKLAETAELPIVLYNVPAGPSPTSSRPRWRGSSRLSQGVRRGKGCQRRHRPRVGPPRRLRPDFVQLSGNDDMALAFNAMGGRGCISVSANVAPRLCAEFQAACQSGDYANALALQDRLWPLHDALFTDASPGR